MDAPFFRGVPAIERLHLRSVIDDNGCWVWQGSTNQGGYGHFRDGPVLVQTHRFAYEYYRGQIPEGLVLDHLCRNRRCCNPEHLNAVTTSGNIHAPGSLVTPGQEQAEDALRQGSRTG